MCTFDGVVPCRVLLVVSKYVVNCPLLSEFEISFWSVNYGVLVSCSSQ